MTYLLDTNACIGHLRSGGNSKVSHRLAASAPGDVVLCSVVAAELHYGAHRSANASKNLVEVRKFLAGFVSVPFDDAAADVAAEVRSLLTTAGIQIGPYNLLIASIARAHRLTVVTHNTSEFRRVPSLLIEDWEV